jgi:hypothetical protein
MAKELGAVHGSSAVAENERLIGAAAVVSRRPFLGGTRGRRGRVADAERAAKRIGVHRPRAAVPAGEWLNASARSAAGGLLAGRLWFLIFGFTSHWLPDGRPAAPPPGMWASAETSAGRPGPS